MPFFGQDSEVYDRKRGGEEVGRGLGNDIRPDLNPCPRGSKARIWGTYLNKHI